jgi:hypothetical protein
MFVIESPLPATRTSFSNSVSVIESDEAFVVLAVQRERVFQSVRPPIGDRHASSLKLDPVLACLIEDHDLLIQLKQGIQAWVASGTVLHLARLSPSDNQEKSCEAAYPRGITYFEVQNHQQFLTPRAH